jgi:PAS domain S-box-containing protein
MDTISTSGNMEKSEPEKKRNARSRYRVCHIDDDSDFLHLFRIKYSKYFNVDSFTSVEDAFDAIINGEFDAIVTDYDMPIMDGLELLEKLQQKVPILPVIFCTGQGSEDLARKAFMMGAADYFTKNLYEPAQKETLANSVIKAVEASKSEIAKLEMEENYKTLVEAAGMPVFRVDANGDFLFMNQIAAISLGGKPEDFVGKNMFDLFPEPIAKRQLDSIRKVMETGIPMTAMKENIVNGVTGLYHTKLFPLKNYLGKITSVIGSSLDITEQFRKEKDLRDREMHFRVLYDDAPVPYQSIDINGSIIEVNDVWLNALGYRKEEVMGRSFEEFLTDESRRLFPQIFSSFKETGSVMSADFDVIRKTGEIMSVEFDGKIRFDENHDFVQAHCIFRDFTEVKRAEKRFYRVVQEIPFPLVITNNSGDTEYINPEFTRVFGYTIEDVKNVAEWYAKAYPNEEIRKAAIVQWQEDAQSLNDNSAESRVFKVSCKNGEQKIISFKAMALEEGRQCIIGNDISKKVESDNLLRTSVEKTRNVLENMPVMLDAFDENGNILVWNKECERITGYQASEIIGNPQAMSILYPDQDYLCQIIESFEKNKEWELTCKDGTKKTIAWSSISGEYPVPGWSYWAVGADVTERKNIEDGLKAKNKELNDFTYRVSHDLKNPIHILKGYMNLIRSQPEDFDELFGKVEFQMDRLLSIINSLLALSRAGRIIDEKMNFDLKEAVKKSFAENYQPGTDAILMIDEDVEPVKVDPAAFSLVMDNLMQNAFRYRDPQKEKLVITLDVGKNGKTATIAVSDNGIGIEPKNINRIFEPGYTSNKKVGNGFGLTIIQKIVNAHNGSVWVESEGKGKGSAFFIKLNDQN